MDEYEMCKIKHGVEDIFQSIVARLLLDDIQQDINLCRRVESISKKDHILLRYWGPSLDIWTILMLPLSQHFSDLMFRVSLNLRCPVYSSSVLESKIWIDSIFSAMYKLNNIIEK